MTFRMFTRLAILAIAAAVALAGCASSRLLQQHANPQYAGKPFKRVLVVAVTKDDLARRVFEDRMVALLSQRGIEGVRGYSVLSRSGAAEEAVLRRVIAETGVDGVFLARATRVEETTINTPGYNVAVGVGTGWGGFYGYYNTIWQTTYVPPSQTSGPSRTVSETRLYDARTGTLAWSGTVATTERDGDTLGAEIQQYVDIVFEAMVRDGVV